MCIISICPKGTIKNSEKVLKFIEIGFDNNKQGSGYMFKRHNDTFVNIRKGFFDLQTLLNSIKIDNLQIEDELVIHHRIGNVGNINNENTHPFVISKKHTEIINQNIKIDKPALVHNGTFRNISIYNNLDKDYSDTYAFTRYIIGNKNIMSLLLEDQELFENTLEPLLNSSRLCFLFPDRDLIKIGKFIEDEGYFHSNEGYFKINTYNYGGYNSYSRNYWDDDYDNYNNKKIIVNNTPKITQNNITNSTIKNNLGLNNSKFKIILLDNLTIKLDKFNYEHFWVCNKKDIDQEKPKYTFKHIENYDPDSYALYTSLKTTDVLKCNDIRTGVLTEKLLTDYYYIPKVIHYQLYQEYKNLIDIKESVGKNTYKKLESILFKNINVLKNNEDKIFYSKTGVFQTKKVLIMYKDYLKNFILLNKFEVDKLVDMSFSD